MRLRSFNIEKIAIYRKGGIGKSTITSSLVAAFAVQGYKVMQIGYDSKADSTSNLLGNQEIVLVMTYLRKHEDYPALSDILKQALVGSSAWRPAVRLPEWDVPVVEF